MKQFKKVHYSYAKKVRMLEKADRFFSKDVVDKIVMVCDALTFTQLKNLSNVIRVFSEGTNWKAGDDMYGEGTVIISDGQVVELYKILPEERVEQLRELMIQLEQRGCEGNMMFVFISTAVGCFLKNWSAEKILTVMVQNEEKERRDKGGGSVG